MNLLFYIIEPLIFIAAGYLIVIKKDLSIFYLPSLFFASTIIDSALPAIVEYALYSFFTLFLIYQHPDFYKKNIYAAALFVLYVILIPTSTDLILIRPTLFAVLWMFLLIPVSMAVIEKYPRTVLFEEMTRSAFLLLVLFCVNVFASTVFKFSPHEMYGMTSGILYGNLVDTDFNVLGVACFICLFYLTYKKSYIYLTVTLLSALFILLSMRRSVILVCFMAVVFILIIMVGKNQIKQALSIFGVILTLGVIIVLTTNLVDTLEKRYIQRNLAGREFTEESRFVEYDLLYKDIFVHYDYSPWIGYELLNSGGHYGKGIFGDRSLHGDITNIIHSTGIIGFFLYVAMVFLIFVKAVKGIKSYTDKLIVFFCFVTFIVFTITGRYTQIGYMLMLIQLLMLPCGKINSKRLIPNIKQEKVLQMTDH